MLHKKKAAAVHRRKGPKTGKGACGVHGRGRPHMCFKKGMKSLGGFLGGRGGRPATQIAWRKNEWIRPRRRFFSRPYRRGKPCPDQGGCQAASGTFWSVSALSDLFLGGLISVGLIPVSQYWDTEILRYWESKLFQENLKDHTKKVKVLETPYYFYVRS